MKRATRNIVLVLAAALPVFGLPAPAGAGRKQDGGAAALIKRAIALSDIQARGAPAFRLHALLRVRYADGKSEEGHLLRIWTPAGLRHYEESLAGYHSVEVTSGKKAWVASNLRYLPFPMFLAERAFGVPGALQAAKGRRFDEPFRSASGERCVRTDDAFRAVKYCFDPENGELRKVTDSLWNVTYEYSNYESFGEKKFPREARVLHDDGSVFIDLRVDQLVPAESLDLRAFLPVKGSKERPLAAQCREIQRPKLEKMVRPEFPEEAEKAGLTGVVRLYAEIGADGIPRGMWPINASPPILRQVAIEAVRQWRYRPQTCKVTGAKMPLAAPITVLFVSR